MASAAEAEAQSKAGEFRAAHYLGLQPIPDVATLIEQVTGYDVAVLDAPDNEHGMTARDPKGGMVIIAVARTMHPMRQRSTLAHELAHVLFKDDWAALTNSIGWSARSESEIRADAFARHLLIPVEGVKEFLGARTAVELSTLSNVVQWFLVSPAIAAIALEQAGYIDQPTKKLWMTYTAPHLASRFGWMDRYQGLQSESMRTRAPERLNARAVKGYEESVVSIQTIARLRGVPVEDVQDEFAESGIRPLPATVQWETPEGLPLMEVDTTDADDLLFPDEDDGSPGAAGE